MGCESRWDLCIGLKHYRPFCPAVDSAVNHSRFEHELKMPSLPKAAIKKYNNLIL
jgi:hypothetical protein